MPRFLFPLLLVPGLARAQPAADPDVPEPQPQPQPQPQPELQPQPQPQLRPQPQSELDPIAACKQLRHQIVIQASTISDAKERGRLLVTLPDCAHPDARALARATSVSDDAFAEPIRYHRNGLAFGIQLELAAASGLGTSEVSAPSTHMFIGSQGDSAVIGLMFDLEHDSESGP